MCVTPVARTCACIVMLVHDTFVRCPQLGLLRRRGGEMPVLEFVSVFARPAEGGVLF